MAALESLPKERASAAMSHSSADVWVAARTNEPLALPLASFDTTTSLCIRRIVISAVARGMAGTSETAAAVFELLSLPHDCLLTVLSQPNLGARELCRLEQTSRSVRACIANEVWQRVFLSSRRHPALGPPSSWKSELSRREDWSRFWRQRGLAGCESPNGDPSLTHRNSESPSSASQPLGSSLARWSRWALMA